MSNLELNLKNTQKEVDKTIKSLLPIGKGMEKKLFEAIYYSILSSGKRLRPFLVIQSSKLFDVDEKNALRVASSIEMIHAYSLIHDDLPSMDDDNLRRGKPTCHIAFDEATAIFAGDALQPLAYSVISNSKSLDEKMKVMVLKKLSYACGWNAMVEGQMKDIFTKGDISMNELDRMHTQKTGELIMASLEIGGRIAYLNLDKINALNSYGGKIGLAFQIKDDIIDIESPTSVSGKRQGSDIIKEKITYPRLVGIDASKKRAKELIDQAQDDLNIFSNK